MPRAYGWWVGVLVAGAMVAGRGWAQTEAPAAAVQTNAVEVKEGAATNVPLHAVTNAPQHAVTNIAPPTATNEAPKPPVTPVVAVPETPAPGGTIPVAEESQGRWKVGTRYLNTMLQDTHRGTENNGSFVGTITELKDKQDSVPDKLFVQRRITDLLWIGVSYDRVEAKTWEGDRPADKASEAGSDGDVELTGVIPYIQAVWENSTRFEPYAEVGFAYYQSKFNADAGWSQGGSHKMNLDNTTGLEVAGGTGIRLYKNWSADLYARYMEVSDVNGSYTLYGSKQSDIVFTMSYVAVGVGVTCRF